ncbi:BTAD domain-containing putative transcriptional regulator [Tumebacillus permanentifrigoris]|uniref:BTAD domain-containing putative transcriptional regulator n=1 Tax=Tumebacillus permanentifrigoris TaxID=378543 RepID=UPI0014728371|nr:BTAD domain-containing putative transcriptional regulator [Tumebacillus permanentifrigoris]
MREGQYVLTTKLVPPRVKQQCLKRRRLDELFSSVIDYPVTLVQADAGYGKSTALVTHLCPQFDHVAWCSLEEGERDPLLFLQYLIRSVQTLDPALGERSRRLLEEAEATTAILQPCLTLLLNDLAEGAPDPSILVLDDYHTIANVPEIRTLTDLLIRYLPGHVHLVLGSRNALDTPAIKRLNVTCDLLLIDKTDLAFTAEEIDQLFRQAYGLELSSDQAGELLEQTEGWIIALQMVWKGMERGVELPKLWHLQGQAGVPLFHYLAEEVFDRQPPEVRAFLTRTSLLESMNAPLCDLLLEREDSAETLRHLESKGLFVTGSAQGTEYRYHRLFQQFLLEHSQSALTSAEWADLHRTAAGYYCEQGDLQKALSHYDEAGDADQVVYLLLERGAECLANGRMELLKGWIDRLPSSVLERHPQILYWRGEIDRVTSRFHEAVHWYTLAEGAFIQKSDPLGRSYVYRGQAQVYLDTIQPGKATPWLHKAIDVLEERYPHERAALLRLLAENHTNSGQLHLAESFLQRAGELVPSVVCDELDVRLHLRAGRLRSACELTQEFLGKDSERAPQRIAKSHREMTLLRSLIDSMTGELDSARSHAEQGIEVGQELRSPFVEMVGYIRLGHAVALAGDLQTAQEHFRRSVQMADSLLVERGKVEAMMGLCHVAGMLGDLEQAHVYARTGLELALNVEDLWCANLIRLAIGGIWTAWGQDEEALTWLAEAEQGFLACGDTYCLTTVRLFLSILYHRNGRSKEFEHSVRLLFEGVEDGGYENIFLRRTMFGPHDLQMTIPFLLAARDELGLEGAERLLKAMGGKHLLHHPGYTLRICTLGHFEVYRGLEEVGRKEWKREKSKQLFQLLVTRQGQLLQRDEIYDLLWPDVDEKTANRDFKVAMNALTNALEPKREARSDSFFVERVDTAYRLNRQVAVWVDAEEFKALVEKGLALAELGDSVAACRELKSALAHYRGDYLQYSPYLDWCAAERERLRTLYLRAQEVLSRLSYEGGDVAGAVRCAETILAHDACWEPAYRLLMNCYAQIGNRNLLISTYKNCVTNLEEHLGLEPMEETARLYRRLVRE